MRYFAVLFCMVFLPGCGKQYSSYEEMLKDYVKGTVPSISTDSLQHILADSTDVLLLDTRSYEEFQVSHLPGARFQNPDYFDIEDYRFNSLNRKIVVYCSVGYRSEKIGEQFIQAGFHQVQNLHGGIFQWCNEGRMMERDSVMAEEKSLGLSHSKTIPTSRIHTYSRSWSRWVTKGQKEW